MKVLQALILVLSPTLIFAQWEQIGQTVYGVEEYGYLGEQVSISDDGSTVAASSPIEDFNGIVDVGVVRVYRLIANTWTQLGSPIYGVEVSEGFGNSISLNADGNTLAVGSEWGEGGNGYVKVFNYSDGDWVQMGSMMTNAQSFGNFGSCVSLSDDGLTVGMTRTGSNGIYGAHVYDYDGNDWVSSAAFGASGNMRSCGMSGDGNTFVFGGPAWAYPAKRIDGTWTVLSNLSTGTTGVGNGSNFISVSGDGNVWAMGGAFYDGEATDGGQIKIYDMTDIDAWQYSTIYGSNFNDLGNSVSLNYDGSILAALGGPNRIYTNTEDEWVLSYTIPESANATHLNAAGDMLAIGTNSFNSPDGIDVGRMLVYGDLPNTAPTMDCPVDVVISNDTGMCGAILEFSAPSANDLEDGAIMSVQTAGIESGELFPLGSSTVEFTATDSEGLSVTCQYVITVEDNEAPHALCNDFTVSLGEDGMASILAEEVDNGSTDNCEMDAFAISTTTFSCENLGVNTVELTVTDNAGNQSVCPSIVTVVDVIGPEALCQPVNVELDENGIALVSVEEMDTGSTDNCGLELTASMVEFDCGNLGQNAVTITAVDASGNTSTCISEVTVSDVTAPTMICQDVTVSLDEEGEGAIVLQDIDNGSFDNCLVALSADVVDFTCGDIALPVEVTLTGTDFVGNNSSCIALVTVVDEIAPEVVCPSDETVLVAQGESFTLPYYFLLGSASATDNCTPVFVDLLQEPSPGTELNVGEHVVTISAQDESLNIASCSFTIVVDIETEINEVTASNFRVFPNPTSGNILIDSSELHGLQFIVQIFDLAGRQVYSGQSIGGQEIALSSLDTGEYILRITSENEVQSTKLIILGDGQR